MSYVTAVWLWHSGDACAALSIQRSGIRCSKPDFQEQKWRENSCPPPTSTSPPPAPLLKAFVMTSRYDEGQERRRRRRRKRDGDVVAFLIQASVVWCLAGHFL